MVYLNQDSWFIFKASWLINQDLILNCNFLTFKSTAMSYTEHLFFTKSRFEVWYDYIFFVDLQFKQSPVSRSNLRFKACVSLSSFESTIIDNSIFTKFNIGDCFFIYFIDAVCFEPDLGWVTVIKQEGSY